MCGTFIVGIVISHFLWFITGRIFRGLFKGFLWFIGMGIIGFIVYKIGIIKEFLQEYQKFNNVYAVIGIFCSIGFIIGIIFEILGKHHAYGGPREPSKPHQ
jgi:MFS family permease